MFEKLNRLKNFCSSFFVTSVLHDKKIFFFKNLSSRFLRQESVVHFRGNVVEDKSRNLRGKTCGKINYREKIPRAFCTFKMEKFVVIRHSKRVALDFWEFDKRIESVFIGKEVGIAKHSRADSAKRN